MSKQEGNYSSNNIIKMLKISKKQYHNRILKLSTSGLLKVDRYGSACPSVLCSVLLNAVTTIETALNMYSKLRTIDAMELSDADMKQIDSIIESMIEDNKIKLILKKLT